MESNCVRVLETKGLDTNYGFGMGRAEGVAGVGVLVAERWIDSVVQVKRVG